MGIPSGNRVERLRVRGSRLDPLQAGLRAERALAQTELCPPGLPKDAVLIVRRLHDPMPGTLRLRHADERPSPVWQQALRGSVADLMQEAARPAHGTVPAASNAVLFAAHDELLACLARDWCDGTLIGRWWWRDLLRHADVSRRVLEYWLSTPEYVPAAIELLDRGGEAARFVSVLTKADVLPLLDRVARTHGLVALMPVLQRVDSKRPLGHGENGRAAVPQRDHEAWKDPASVVVDPTALRFLPQMAARQLAAPQCVLLDVCLGLRRAPGVVRSDAYAATIATVLRVCDDATATDVLMEPKTDLTASLERKDGGVAGAHAADELALAENRRPVIKKRKVDSHISNAVQNHFKNAGGPFSLREKVRMRGIKSTDFDPLTPTLSRRERETVPVPEAQGPSPALTPAPSRRESDIDRAVTFGRVDHRPTEDGDHTPVKHVEDVKPTPRQLTSPRSAENKPLSRLVDTRVVRTRLGGAFYLINVALFLELYGDFTSPLRPGIALPIWDFIALITAQLLGRGFRRDALWPLLAELAARPVKQAPGRGFEPPEAWRMPDSWLVPFRTEGLWQATSDGGRLRVFHPAGFMVLDVPLDVDDPRAQLVHELSPYVAARRTSAVAELESPATAYRVDAGPPLRRWLGWLMPYVRARLAVALSVPANKKLGSLVCYHKAQVALTPTHLDITFALAELPIKIRLSGLDRDPGWVPAAGRVIRFHYE